MASILDTIMAAKRREVRAREQELPRQQLMEQAARAPRARSLAAALRPAQVPAAGKPRLIAEIKRRSPSAGAIVENLDVPTTVWAYEQAGAAAISVLTDEQFFGGSLADLAAARAATTLPILRKDFTVSTYQIFEARVAGADAILVIVAATEEANVAEYVGCAAGLGMDAIVEVHTADELTVARRAGAKIHRDQQPRPANVPGGPGYDGPTDGDGAAGDDHRQRERYPHGRRRAAGTRLRRRRHPRRRGAAGQAR